MDNRISAPPSGSFPTVKRTPVLDRLARQEELQAELRQLSKDLARTVPDITETELSWLYDTSRADSRSRHLNIARYVDLSSRSTDAEVRSRLCEFVRAWTQRNEPILGVFEASDAETRSNGAFDVAMHDFESHPTRETQQRAIETGAVQLAATRATIDAVRHATLPAGNGAR